MLVVGHDHGNMAVGSIVLSVVPIGKLIGTRKSEFAGSPPLAQQRHSPPPALPPLVWARKHGRAVEPPHPTTRCAPTPPAAASFLCVAIGHWYPQWTLLCRIRAQWPICWKS